MSRRNRVRARSLSIAACVVFGVLRAASASAEGLSEALAPQPLADALEMFSQQTGLQLVYDAALTRGIKTEGASAGQPTEQTLRELLRGTGLAFEFVNERTVTIVAAPAASSQQESVAASDPARIAATSPEGLRRIEVEEVLVTGSHIRGAPNRTAPVTVYTRQDIERTGYTSVQQFIEAIPQNFGGDPGGVSEDGIVGRGSAKMTNAEAASAINLRGLGVGSTLVLINGRRVAPSANASAVDVSIIPLSAIERVEVLTDGSSAIYGSEAVAGVVNFILRSDYDGAETNLSFGTVTDGGLRELTAAQTFGSSWSSGNLLLGVQHQQRDAMDSREREFTSLLDDPTDVLPKRSQTAVLLNARQQLPAGFDVFGQALYSELESKRRYTLDIGAASLSSLRSRAAGENTNVSLGVGYRLGDWRVELSGLHARQFSDLDGDATPVGSLGALKFTRDYRLNSAELKADGRLFELPGGTVRLAIGGGYRKETYDLVPLDRHAERDVSSLYAELSVPLIDRAQSVPLVHNLELSAAARYDDYSDFGSTDNPRIGLVWSPIRGLDLRAAYSTSFRAPSANELDLSSISSNQQVVPYPLTSPSGSGTVTGLLIIGAKELQAEQARSWTYGFTYTPAQLAGLSATFNYYDIEHTNRIGFPTFARNVLQFPDIYGSLIRRYENDAQVQAEVAAFLAAGGILRDFFGLGLAGIRYGYDLRMQNFAAVEQRGLDLGLDYRWQIGGHGIYAGLYATKVDTILTSFGEDTRTTDLVNTVANPLRWRGRANFGWTHGAWSANASANYSNSYEDISVTPTVPVDEWLTFDLNVRLTLDDSRMGWWRGASIALSVINAFDEDPPAIVGNRAAPTQYDAANATPLGRFVALALRKSW